MQTLFTAMLFALSLPTLHASDFVALAGQWVTRPNGEKVCQISRNVAREEFNAFQIRQFCSGWRVPIPPYNSPVLAEYDWLRTAGGPAALFIGGRWVY